MDMRQILVSFADLRKKPAGYRTSYVYHQLSNTGEEPELRHEVSVSIFLLDDESTTVAYKLDIRYRVLSDKIREYGSAKPWKTGTLENVAEAVSAGLVWRDEP